MTAPIVTDSAPKGKLLNFPVKGEGKQVVFNHFEALQAIWHKDNPLPLIERAVATVLAKHANAWTGQARPGPGLHTIADEAGISKPTALKAINGLEAKGLIAVVRYPRKTKKRPSNDYMLTRLTSQLALLVKDVSLNSKAALPESLKENLLEDITYVSPSNDADPASDVLPPVASEERTTRKSKTTTKKTPPASKSKEAKPKKENPFGPQAKELVTLANRLLKERDRPGLSGRPWGVSEKAASSALADNCPFEELAAAITWAAEDARRRADLQANGLRYVKRLWSDWLERDTKPRYGNSRPAPTAEPQFDPNGPWADTN